METASPLGEEPAAELMICPCCHHHNNPRVNFCLACGAPIGATAALGAYEHILAEGFILREAANGHTKAIVVIGIWFLFLPIFLGSCLMLAAEIWYFDPGLHSITGLLTMVFCAGTSAAIIYRTTVNHRRKIRQTTQAGANPPG